MRIHCFQHVHFEGLACIEDWIKKKNHSLTYTRFFENDPFPQLDTFDMLIVMGGPMSFDDDDKYDWMADEKKFIKKAINADKTVLGICLGAQFIAEAIDGSGRHKDSSEIGWFPIQFKKACKKNGLDFIPDELTVFHWHGDTFDIPKGAVHIAGTQEYPNQAFLYNERVMGLQFHFEINEASLKGMIENADEEIKPGRFVQMPKEMLLGLKYAEVNNPIMWKVMDFLEEKTI